MQELKDIFTDKFKNEINNTTFIVLKMTGNLSTHMHTHKGEEWYQDTLLILDKDNDCVFDILISTTQEYLNFDSARSLTQNELKMKFVPVLTDIFTFQKDKHDLNYFKNMANQLHDETGLPIKFLLFKPIFDRFNKELKDRLIFKVTNDYQ